MTTHMTASCSRASCVPRTMHPVQLPSGTCWRRLPQTAGPLLEHVSTQSSRCGRDISCQSAETSSRVADEDYMEEYAKLKSSLADTTRKSGAAVAAYLLFAVNGQAALCCLLGMGFSNLYLMWLFRDVDNVQGTDRVPMMEARDIEAPVQRYLAMWLTSYYHALRPRLLVPVALAALMAAYNSLAEEPLSGIEQASLLIGFLSYKVALILKVANELSLKEYVQQNYRPTIQKFDEALELDQWGRPLKPQYTMPTEALPEDVDTENMGLLPNLLLKTAESSLFDDDDEGPGSRTTAAKDDKRAAS